MMKKRLAMLATIAALCVMNGAGTMAEETVAPVVPQAENGDEGIQPCIEDEIVFKYRYNANTKKYEYRRWNATKGYWVDPYWIVMG